MQEIKLIKLNYKLAPAFLVFWVQTPRADLFHIYILERVCKINVEKEDVCSKR